MPEADTALVIVARVPRLGEVKTRLTLFPRTVASATRLRSTHQARRTSLS
jgi:hypothetical protein